MGKIWRIFSIGNQFEANEMDFKDGLNSSEMMRCFEKETTHIHHSTSTFFESAIVTIGKNKYQYITLQTYGSILTSSEIFLPFLPVTSIFLLAMIYSGASSFHYWLRKDTRSSRYHCHIIVKHSLEY